MVHNSVGIQAAKKEMALSIFYWSQPQHFLCFK